MQVPPGEIGQIAEWLRAEELEVEVSDDGTVLELTIPDSGDRTIRIIRREGDSFLLFSMTAARSVLRNRWTALYPLLSQVNSEIAFGAWVLDTDTDTMVYRLAIPAFGASYEAACLRAVISEVALTVQATESAFRSAVGDDILNTWLTEELEAPDL